MVILLALLACRPEAPPASEPSLDPMGAVAVLSRASLDLRARRPSEAEILRVEADPAALDDLLDEFVEDPAFPERLVSLYSEVLRTRADRYLVNFDSGADFLDDAYNLAFRHSVGEEPLRLVAHVAAEDLPYTELVTADYTMANEALLAHLPLVALEEGEGWRPARYLDERPAAGILATTGMWWRYTSTFENANRGRAQAIARSLLCDDRFEAAVSFQGETSSLEDRVQTDPTCISCHASLDPIGSYLWGFTWRNQEAWLEVTRYAPTGEMRWMEMTGVPPSFYGAPGEDLQDLGVQMADDPRFVSCAVETGMEMLLDRPLDAADATWESAHREAFLAGGLRLKALYRSIVDDPRYRAADADDPDAAPVKRMRPDQLAGSLEALTGYRWTWQGNDMLDTDEHGVRVLAGGVDGVLATQPASDPSTTTVLVEERVATAAARWAVTREAPLAAEERVLFREVALDEAPSEAEIAAQVQALLLRCHGRRVEADDADVSTLVDLWGALHERTGDPATAWALVLSAILRHPDFVLY